MIAALQLDIFILTCGRLSLLQACCESVLAALPASSRVTVLINGADETTQAWLSAHPHPALAWRAIPLEARGAARNRAFAISNAELIYFLDDDVIVPPHLFQDCLETFSADPDLFLLGGPNLTLPDAEFAELLYGAVMTTWGAAPMVRARYGGVPTEEKLATELDLMLCNLAIRRNAKPADLNFPESLSSNEENVFLFCSAQAGRKVLFRGRQFVFHRRRTNLLSFARQVCSYGLGRAQQTWMLPRSSHPAFAIPLICLLSVPLLLSAPGGRSVLFWLLGLYALLAIASAFSSREIRQRGSLFAFGVALLTPVVHLAYAWGTLLGAIGGRNKKSVSTKCPPNPSLPVRNSTVLGVQ